MAERHDWDEHVPTTSAADEREWEDFEPTSQMFVADPTRLAPTAIRSRRARFVVWMAIVGTLGLALASVVVR